MDIGLKYNKKIKLNFHFLKSRDNTQSIYNKINGSIIHLTDELDTLVNDNALHYFNIDTSIVLSGNTIETLYDFYTPLINSSLPSNLTPGTYRLRIRATLGYDGDPNGWSLESNDYSEVVYEFDEFEVQNLSLIHI